MGLSIRAYARHRGVSHVAVKKAIDAGRITTLPDGTLDPEQADAQWARNTVQPRSTGTPKASPRTRAPEEGAASLPPTLGSGLGTGGVTLLQARTVNEVLKAKIRQVELAEKKDELIDRARAIAHVFKLARAERDAWLNWPARAAPMLAARLGLDEHALHVALDAAVREHLAELGEIAPRIDA
jgi:hypothetical protein